MRIQNPSSIENGLKLDRLKILELILLVLTIVASVLSNGVI